MISSILNLAGPDLLVIMPCALVVFGVYLWMLIDCATKEPDPNQRLIWLLIIIFVPLGFAVYFFVRKLSRSHRDATPS
jgi:hypothetical protein